MTQRSQLEQQTMALAGVAQAARLVDQISRTGSYPVEFLEATIHSLFSFETPDVDSVYGNIQGIKLGLQNLSAGLSATNEESSASMMRYLMAIIYLERKFSSRGDLQQVVHSRLKHSQ